MNLRKLFVFSYALTLLPHFSAAETDQLFNLKDVPESPRFELPKDRTWPAEPGEADVCLWDGDRFAALSITIDDNNAPDHEWWAAISDELGMKVTWFVITNRVGNGSQWGSWDGFSALQTAGHGVQSHTATHLNNSDDPEWPGIEWEYAQSQKELEANVPGNRALTVAYSGGKMSKGKHDYAIAAEYYIAGRGGYGTPNRANQIYYMNTSSTSGRIGRDYVDAVLEGTSGVHWLGNNKFLRGWLCSHFHTVHEKQRAEVAEKLRYIKSREADLWVGRFDEVVRYGMERDTHMLEVTKNSNSAIEFVLSDRMDDSIYTIPLTVKVHLPDGWKGASAEQGGKKVDCQTVEHEGARYALVWATPDQGAVVLTPSA